jgi:hypothetical protein
MMSLSFYEDCIFTCRRLRTASAALATAAPAHTWPCTSREARGNEAALPVHKEGTPLVWGTEQRGISVSGKEGTLQSCTACCTC